ncbi:MAG: glycosyltransferase family 4 protein [Bacteroidota bacterium]
MHQKLKILSIVPFPLFPITSGGQKKTIGLLNALSDKVTIKVVTPVPPGCQLPENIDVSPHILPLSFLRYIMPFSLPRLIKLAKDVDIIMMEQPFFGGMMYLLAFLAKKKWVVQAHNIEYQRFKSIGKWWWFLLKKYEGWVFRKANAVFFITEEDRITALKVFSLPPQKCFVSTYGIDFSSEEKNVEVHNTLHVDYNIPANHAIFLFFGVMSYAPNLEALTMIISKLLPQFEEKGFTDYTVLVCGKDLPEYLQYEINTKHQRMIYAGFVADINIIIKQSDVVLNPILTGGGVKTKVIEAIALNKTVVSSVSGAIGIDRDVCGTKLMIAPDNQWELFATLCISALENTSDTPVIFYETYTWEAIANDYLHKIQQLIRTSA